MLLGSKYCTLKKANQTGSVKIYAIVKDNGLVNLRFQEQNCLFVKVCCFIVYRVFACASSLLRHHLGNTFHISKLLEATQAIKNM